MEPERLFSYKMTHDTGFAPNPFWGYLTLATCKPKIREAKLPGDWIAGFTSGTLCGDAVGLERLVFLMQVDEKMTIADYFRDERFSRKIPLRGAADHRRQVGDNIYRPLMENPLSDEEFVQVDNYSHGPGEKSHDLSGHYVLAAKRFAYFGRKALFVPADCRPTVPYGQAPSGQRTHDPERVMRLIEFVKETSGLDAAVVAPPHTWPTENGSWQGKREKCSIPQRKTVIAAAKQPRASARRC